MIDHHKKFVLGDEGLTAEHFAFYNKYGFIHFRQFFNPEQIKAALDAIASLQEEWITAGLTKVNGIPLKYGKDENSKTIVQRFAFASLHSEYLHQMLQDERIQWLKEFIGDDARIAENEKDGLVVNHYVNTGESNFTKLGWHTDGLRDLFTNLKLNPMLNIGIYLDDSPIEKGGLRLLPGTHRQGIYSMLFRKRYFVDNNPDDQEIALEAQSGDLTVHSGRIWHRVALSPLEGIASKRRVMYFPIIKGKYKPKTEESWTPIYHKFHRLVK
ncbi:MAG TPA: phytanoyl-CoA dioxygenase family protein [Chitinophagaceae bacterium]|nr:phytanoyl-CoA dioxygenase family protein [Chitinophagaceae bacterium]